MIDIRTQITDQISSIKKDESIKIGSLRINYYGNDEYEITDIGGYWLLWQGNIESVVSYIAGIGDFKIVSELTEKISKLDF